MTPSSHQVFYRSPRFLIASVLFAILCCIFIVSLKKEADSALTLKNNDELKAATKSIDSEFKKSERKIKDVLANESEGIRFQAKPSEELHRSRNNTLLLPDARRITRQFIEGKVFDGQLFQLISGEAKGPLTINEFTKSATEATIRLEEVERFLASDAEYLTIPLTASENILMSVERVYDRGSHTVSLTGKLKDQTLSTATLVFHDGKVSGSIELHDDFRLIDYGSAGNGNVAIREMDTSIDHGDGCATCEIDPDLSGEEDVLTDTMDENTTPSDNTKNSIGSIDPALMGDYPEGSYVSDGVITYTQVVRDLLGGVSSAEADMILAFDAANNALVNSRIDDVYFTLLAIGEEPVADYSRNLAYYNLRDEEVYASELGDLLGADVDIVIYSGSSGVANTIPGIGRPPEDRRWFVVGHSSIKTSGSTFVHEYGHICGGSHDWRGSGTPNLTGTGWRLYKDNGNPHRTIMAYQPNTNVNFPRIGYFSSPTQTLPGDTAPIGAEAGFDGTDNPHVEQTLVGFGFDGTNPELAADNQTAIIGVKSLMPLISTRVSHAILEPLGGEVFESGYTLPVSWIGGDQHDTVTIDLYKDGVIHSHLDTVSAHLRFNEADIPVATAGSDYSIHLTFDTGETIESNQFSISEHIPTAEDIAVLVYKTQPANITLTSEGISYTYSYSQPSGGVLTGTAPDLVYTANEGTLSDSFTYSITFGDAVSETKTVSITAAQPVAHWKLDDATDNVITDASGNNHHGTLISGTIVEGRGGLGALDFNAGNDSVSLPASAFATVSNQITVSMWVWGDTTQALADTVFYALNAGDQKALNIHLPWSTGSIIWDAGYETTYDRLSYSEASASDYSGRWNLWTFTKDASVGTMKMYLNGEKVAEQSDVSAAMDNITDAYLGSGPGVRSYDGKVDDVQLFDMALSDDQIAAMYQSYQEARGLKAYWPLDDATGIVVKDHSGQGHDGSLISGAWSTGKSNGAIDLNGNSDLITLPVSAFENVTDQFSISFWAYGEAANPHRHAIIRASGQSGTIFNIYLPWNGTTILWDAGDRLTWDDDSYPEYFAGRWNHWVFTKDANTGNMDIYVNGTHLANGTGKTSSVEGVTSAYLGSVNASGGFAYNGLIDEVKIYNVSLSLSEVSELYTSYTDYHTWLSQYPNMMDTSMTDDPENDGIETMLEYVLNGSPLEPDMHILPTMDAVGSDFVFNFIRRVDSTEEIIQTFQYGSNLSGWTDIDLNNDSHAGVEIGAESDGLQNVTVTIDKDLDVGGKLFGRLKVERAP